ncbi:hypothetical protein DBB31_05755 [Burkholderia multivorans]|nr:hypothetical protein DBB31_05755 [Burkholderia multivorans]
MVEVMRSRDVNVFGALIIENVCDLSMTREGCVSRCACASRARGSAARRQFRLYRRMRRCGAKPHAFAGLASVTADYSGGASVPADARACFDGARHA